MADKIEQPTRALANQQLPLVGLGCMGMSDFYGGASEEQSIATLHHALDIGVTHWDTADMYGPHANERLLSRVLAERRDEVFLATKFGIMRDPDSGAFVGVNGKPEYVRQACLDSLERLGVDQIDLYYFGRGHTSGDSVVVFRALAVAHTGDLFAWKGVPYIDVGNGGSGVAYPDTLDRIVASIAGVRGGLTDRVRGHTRPAAGARGAYPFFA